MSLATVRDRVRRALRDEGLSQPYSVATARARHKRLASIDEVADWEQQRELAARARRDALDHLESYLREFEQRFVEAGGHVHRAADAPTACERVLEILEQNGVTTVLKGKTMLSEEIALNAHLEDAGLQVTETDLGEFIIQLAGQRPSHITAPALHMSRADIGRLFADKLGVEYTDDPTALTHIARQELREHFLTADAGITGGNFLVAETGQLVLIENEANLRLSTTLPSVHIAVVGIEKVVGRLDDLGPLLTVIARSATGQAMGSYASLLDGGGPPTRHVVLVDNGRRAILSNPKRREILACIRCGACLNACPVYELIGGHTYDSTYAGPIGALLASHGVGTSRDSALSFASSLCGACSEVCPVKIDLTELLRHGRERYVDTGGASATERFAWWMWARVLERPRLYQVLSSVTRGLMTNESAIEAGGGPFAAWTEGRALPRPARQSFLEQWKAQGGPTCKSRRK